MTELEKRKSWKALLRSMKESVSLKEAIISKETEMSKTDPKLKIMLEALYLDEDRAASFQRYCASHEFRTISDEVVRHAGGNRNVKICEVGAGPGFLALALAKEGFQNVSLLEPNKEWRTGTGFVASIARNYGVRIWNDIDAWYGSDDLYDLVITKACVHHFDNACKAGAEIRCKLEDDGKWLMFDEFFANSAKDLYSALIDHAHVVKYGQYEWPYSAGLYVDLMHLAGYRLHEVLPSRYKNNYMVRSTSAKIKLSGIVTAVTKLLIALRLTVCFFYIEKFVDRYLGIHSKLRLFTLPQLLVFGLRKMDYPTVPDLRGSALTMGNVTP